MRIRTLSLFLASALTPLISQAAIHPVITLAYGASYTQANYTQNVTIMPPYQDTYITPNQSHRETITGMFLGIESPLYCGLLGQIGLSYYKMQPIKLYGTIWQFTDPDFNNKNYEEKIQNQQILLEGKLLSTIQAQFPLHPYILAGVGESINESFNYSEQPLAQYVVVNPQPFSNHTTHPLTYVAGVGLDVDVGHNIRLGAGYRYTDLGHTNLGPMPGQTYSNILNYKYLHTSEVVFNLTYVV